MRDAARTACAVALLLVPAGACGNVLGLDEPTEATDAGGVDATNGDGNAEGSSGSVDGALGSNDASSSSPDADAAPDVVVLTPVDGGTPGDTFACPSCQSGRCRADAGCDPAVFITSTVYTGSLGGAPGGPEKGDALCNSVKGVPQGTYRAWLSSSASGPASTLDPKRFTKHSTRPYRLLNGDPIALDFTDLKTNGPKIPINLSETGTIIQSTSPVWTGTAVDGLPAGSRCYNGLYDWGIGNGLAGTYGVPMAGKPNWTAAGDDSCTSTLAHLYCFEQQD